MRMENVCVAVLLMMLTMMTMIDELFLQMEIIFMLSNLTAGTSIYSFPENTYEFSLNKLQFWTRVFT